MPENGHKATPQEAPQEALRIDKWFWHARFFKSRSLASKFCQAGKARVNGTAIRKAHHMVRPGDALTFTIGPHVRVIQILALGTRRGPATEAQTLYEDLQPPAAPSKAGDAGAEPAAVPAAPPKRDPGAGRPTKSERRAIDRLMGREEGRQTGKRTMVGRMMDRILGRKSGPE